MVKEQATARPGYHTLEAHKFKDQVMINTLGTSRNIIQPPSPPLLVLPLPTISSQYPVLVKQKSANHPFPEIMPMLPYFEYTEPFPSNCLVPIPNFNKENDCPTSPPYNSEQVI